ncbi:biotin--[acetyl-CoA-carboxylase] ligase [Gammaproteobacteria bacterium]|nr:biotin--[acetyl-CoA-carboxylase] ligase [Gammaproteobacteria bacterium]MDC0577480.1 biotin--[acetyl-CoA-carboxylase] ligase [Gammaproteobacteria bacterium]MDC3323598.1 biotin--[acetyl-CoA-carboxylase] ligase [Gammaproteobacteria bacterium]
MKQTLSPLDSSQIINNLKKSLLDYSPEILITKTTASTNEDAKSYLEKQSSPLSIHLSEQQVAGKGRNGKKWVSPKGKNIYLSIGWISPLQYSELNGLSLAVGTVLASTLNKYAGNLIKIKWPNDLLFKKKKISGILIETVDLGDTVGVVIGIGINVHMTKEEGRDIDQSWISLDEATDSINDRNEVVANLLNELFNLTISFSQEGFKPFKGDFETLDLLKGKMCNVSMDGHNRVVEVMGVNDNGELLVKDNSENLTLRYGEVSIREL